MHACDRLHPCNRFIADLYLAPWALSVVNVVVETSGSSSSAAELRRESGKSMSIDVRPKTASFSLKNKGR